MSEIAYSINSEDTLDQDCLVLDLVMAKKENYGFSLIPVAEGLPVSKWRSFLSEGLDKEVFSFLLKEELSFQQRKAQKTPQNDSFLLKQLHVPHLQVLAALKLLAPTQKLFCRGKQLIVDFFGKTEFYYEGKLLESGGLEVSGRLRSQGKEILLAECEALGPGKPHNWYVRGLSLKMITTAVSWKRLKELKQAPLILDGGAKHAFFEDLDPEDPDSPQLELREGSLEDVKQASSPYPLLQLMDRWGACADLFMDYGHGHLIAFHDSQPLLKDSQGNVLFKRQLDAEAHWERDLLETNYVKKIVGSSHYYCPLEHVAKSLSFMLEMGWKILDFQKRRVVRQSELKLEFEDQGQMIALKGRVRYETFEADTAQVLGAFNRRENFIQLSSNAVGLLASDGSQNALKDLSLEAEWTSDGAPGIRKNRFGALDSLWDHVEKSPLLEEMRNKWQNFTQIQEALPFDSFKGQLRPYQQEGVNWLSFLHEYGFHGILADEMGLGKTVQILAFLSRLPHKGAPKGIHLIVLPTSLLFNWRNEIERFLPSFSCRIHQGADRAKTMEELQTTDILLTSYATLRLDFPLLQSIPFFCVILDEAQMIKNARTQTAQAVCSLDAQMKLCLTGTPIENHLQELWSHFHFLMPDLLGPQEQFEADVQAAESDRRYLDRIKKKTAPFLLRRRKQDVATDLPARLDQVVWVEMSQEQRNLYDQILAGFKKGLLKKVESDGISRHRLEVLEAILRLRQVCCHPLLVSSLFQEGESIPSAKFDLLVQDLETIVDEGHKVLVYSQFTSMLQRMAKEAKNRGWSYGYLDGSTKNREEVVSRFQTDPSQYLFFISLKAGGVGLNLTAADYVYLYDPWWNEAVEEQAINRAHRIGREHPVIAKRLVVAESVEEKMMKIKAAKRVIVEEWLEGEALSKQLTIEDLQYLLT